jgi:hypothetical protein
VLLLVVVLAAGCGSGRLSREKLVERANAICKSYDTQQNSLPFPSTDPIAPKTSFRERAQWGAALNQIVNLGRQEMKALRKLKPPKELEPAWNRLLAAKDSSYDSLSASATAAKRNRPDELKRIGAVSRRKLTKVTSLADAFGVRDCG